MFHCVSAWIAAHHYLAVFTLLVAGLVGIPVPDELVLSYAGVLVAKGQMELAPLLICASLGTWIGLTFSYGLGSVVGHPIVARWERGAKGGRVLRAEQMYQRAAGWVLAFGCFLPGMKHLAAITAGASRYPLRSFASFAYVGAVVWVTLYVLLGYYLGEGWARASVATQHTLKLGFLAAALAALAVYAVVQLRRGRAPDADEVVRRTGT